MALAAAGRAKAKAKASAKAKGQAKASAKAKAKASAKAKAKASAKAKAKASAKAKAKAKAKASAKKKPAPKSGAKRSKAGHSDGEIGELPDGANQTPKKRRSSKGAKPEVPPSVGISAECNEMIQSGLIPPTFGGRGKPKTSSWALEKYCRTAYAFRTFLEKSIVPGTKHRAQARGWNIKRIWKYIQNMFHIFPGLHNVVPICFFLGPYFAPWLIPLNYHPLACWSLLSS